MPRSSHTRSIQPLGLLAVLGAFSAHAAAVGWGVSVMTHLGVAGFLIGTDPHDVEAARIAGGRTSHANEIVVTLPPSPAPVLIIEPTIDQSAAPIEAGSKHPAVDDSMPMLDSLATGRAAESQPVAPRRSVEPAPQERFARSAPVMNEVRRSSDSALIMQSIDAEPPRLARSQVEVRPPTPVAVASLPRTLGTEVDEVAKPIHNPQPVYPAIALANRIEGRVMLHLTISNTGNVVAVRVVTSSQSTALDQAALTTVQLWRFEPARRNGTPVEWECQLPVRFSLSP